MEQLSISAKNLGALAMPERCDRCWWLKQKAHPLPFQIFPGVFSTIDSFSKRLTHGYLERFKRAPPWLASLGAGITPLEVPHWSRFFIRDKDSGIILRGVPDEMIMLADESLAIVDYKTAMFTDGQDALMPMYEHQLGAYAVIAEKLGYDRVTKLLLVYFQPKKEVNVSILDNVQTSGNPAMSFEPAIVEIPLGAMDAIHLLLSEARSLLDQPAPPTDREGCKDCQRLTKLVDMVTNPMSV